jgi:hypothetical protein
MKFLNYINEEYDVEFEKIYSILKTDCLKFLKESKGLLLHRGTENGILSRIVKKAVRQDRRPLDMPYAYHEEFNEILYKKFHWYPRTQGVFATSDKMDAGNFGISNLFFPIGNYKYVWSPSHNDIWISLQSKFIEIFPGNQFYNNKDEHIDWLKTAASTYINSNLYDALVMGHEISFKCDSYYLIKEYYGYTTYFSQKYAQEIRK